MFWTIVAAILAAKAILILIRLTGWGLISLMEAVDSFQSRPRPPVFTPRQHRRGLAVFLPASALLVWSGALANESAHNPIAGDVALVALALAVALPVGAIVFFRPSKAARGQVAE